MNKINRVLILFIGLLTFATGKATAQAKIYVPVIIAESPKTDFSFTKKWAYPWYMVKDGRGKLSKNIEGEITKADKAHLYFTADCKTDVQGGYNIRYCHANKLDSLILLDFRDGLPAYASTFMAMIKDGQFCFVPRTIYPQFVPGQKTNYKVIRQQLTLYQKNYAASKVISGYIDVVFLEIVSQKGKTQEREHYLRGYFKTPLN